MKFNKKSESFIEFLLILAGVISLNVATSYNNLLSIRSNPKSYLNSIKPIQYGLMINLNFS